MTKAIIYTRVSTEEQALGYSLEEQRRKCIAKAKELGVTNILHFEDDGVSGGIASRPALLDAVAALKADKSIKYWICVDPDRLSRNLSDLLVITEQIERCGAELVFVDFRREDTPEGKLFYAVRGAIAEFEKALIARRTQGGKIAKARQGGWTHWPDIYGYDYEDGKVTVNEHEAAVVRLIFRLGAEMGVKAIQDRLAQMGIPSPRAGKNVWSRTTIRRILDNEAYYTGVTYIRKYETHGTHLNKYIQDPDEKYKRKIRPRDEWVEMHLPPIIDKKTFMAAQKRLQNARRKFDGTTAKSRFLLSGLLRCGHCGKTWHGYSTERKGVRASYYVCTYKSPGPPRGSGLERCKTRFVRTEKLEEPVWEIVRSWLLDDEAIRQYNKVVEQRHKDAKKDLNPELDVLRIRVKELEAEEEALLDQLTKAKHARVRDRIGERLEEIAEEIERLKHAIQEIDDASSEIAPTVDEEIIARVRDDYPHPDQMTWEQKYAAIHELIREIVVHQTNDGTDLTIYPHNLNLH